jgi:hypothetical protein
MATTAIQTKAGEFGYALESRVLVADGAMGTALYGKSAFINRSGARRPPGVRQGGRLLPRPATQVLQPRLAELSRLPLRFGDEERPAALILGFIELIFFIFCHESPIVTHGTR